MQDGPCKRPLFVVNGVRYWVDTESSRDQIINMVVEFNNLGSTRRV